MTSMAAAGSDLSGSTCWNRGRILTRMLMMRAVPLPRPVGEPP